MEAHENDEHSKDDNFTQAHKRLFQANEVPSLANLHDDEPLVLAPREWRTHALDLIHRVSHDVIDVTLVSPILNDIASIITSAFPVTHVSIETYDGHNVEYSYTSKSPDADISSGVSLVSPLSNTLAGEVMRRGTTLILSDAHKNDYLVCPSLPQPLHVYHYIGVPLTIDGKIRGVLSIATSHHILVDKETITWSETIAHHISALLTREAVALKLKAQENIAANMLNALTSPTLMCNETGTILHVNSAFRSIAEVFHSHSIDENGTNIFRLFDNPHKSNSYVHLLRQSIKDLFEGNSSHTRLDVLLTRSGFHRWYLATMSLMPDRKTAIIMFVDISDRKQVEEQLEHDMLHDQSTGLANRILFHDRVSTAHSINVEKNIATCVFSLEVGRYSFIVESLGHDAADRIISKVAKRLETIFQQADFIARVGSSEFAIIADHIQNAEQARNFALNMIDLFRDPFEIDGQEILLVPSVGITVTDTEVFLDADMIMHDAHAAMTSARDSVTHYAFASVSSSSEAYQKLNRERELHAAIDKGELVVYYQPEIELLTGRVVGAEALVRWMHPKHGLLSPDHFVGLAEESGLIDSLFECVFSQVVKDAQSLYTSGFDFTLWTNLSAKQFTVNVASNLIADHIRDSQVPSYMFGIEITETAVMENSESASETLRQLKAMGVSLALDDFGTGYSSLAYLQSFPVDTVKIDKSFISEMGTTKSSTEIVSAVIGLAHGLKLRVLAEGVETQQNVTLLRQLGCDIAQGYFYSRPVSFEKFVEYLEKD